MLGLIETELPVWSSGLDRQPWKRPIIKEYGDVTIRHSLWNDLDITCLSGRRADRVRAKDLLAIDRPLKRKELARSCREPFVSRHDETQYLRVVSLKSDS